MKFVVKRTKPDCRAVRNAHGLWVSLALAGLVLSGCTVPRLARTTHKQAKTAQPPRRVWLESFDLSAIEQGWGSPHAARSVDDNPLRIRGHTFARGVGTHAVSEWRINLKHAARRLHAVAGIDDETGGYGTVVFVVYADDREVFRSDVLNGQSEPLTVDLDLKGVGELALVVEDAGDNNYYDHADWAEAYLELEPGSTAVPESMQPAESEPPVLASEVSAAPQIGPPRVTGGSPGRPFLFRLPASGERPLSFTADGLPPGLVLDAQRGVLSGTPQRSGRWEVRLSASNSHGRAESTLAIIIELGAVARTPPMGWNSWNVWGTSVDDAKVRAAADQMVRSGLADYGYQYIIIDDAWAGPRDADGRITANEKFPDMPALAEHVHGLGLKLGIYSSPGPLTCAGYTGSYMHEWQDAQTFATWGIDALKYDWCSYGKIAKDDSLAELQKPYPIMRAALDACGRDIVYMMCQYGLGQVWTWGAKAGGNTWRTTGDITDTWESMSSIGFSHDAMAPYAGPGHWNDPDMLVVGHVGWGPEVRPTHLTQHEQLTHITLWSMLAAPLILGCDLSQLDDFTRALLTNREVIAVDQDPLGRAARRVWRRGFEEVWARPLVDGSMAVALFNRSAWPREMHVTWDELRLQGPQRVRDLWQRRDLGTIADGYQTHVAGHSAVMLRIAAASGGQ